MFAINVFHLRLAALLILLVGYVNAQATVISSGGDEAKSELLLQPNLGEPSGADQGNSALLFKPDSGAPMLRVPAGGSQPAGLAESMQKGLWTRACGIATDSLARKEQSLDALGIFALCQALVSNKQATALALTRLKEAEGEMEYYGILAQGVAQLRNRSPKMADTLIGRALEIKPGDALATYFRGEVLHAKGKDQQAIAEFQAVLKIWPTYAPALSAQARLIASMPAGKRDLKAAIALSEHAASIELTNRAYWEQTAKLCDQAGQHARAQAIRLQWLTPPKLPANFPARP